MKYCEEYAALLDLFVDGELPPEDMARVRAHLADCPGCQAYVDDALALRAGFPEVEETAVPEGFAEGVMERIQKSEMERWRQKKRRSVRRRMETLGALAACCALVILARGGLDGGTKSAADTAGGEAGTVHPYAAVAEDVPAEASAEEETNAALMARSAEKSSITARGKEEAAAEDSVEMRSYEEGVDSFASPPAPETALDAEAPEEKMEAALYLTAEEAGELLDGFTAAWDSGEERGYELTAGEYRALLESLGREEAFSGEDGGVVLVVVSGPFE